MFKKVSFVFTAFLLAAVPALASDLRVDFNGGEQTLRECGGTIEAKGGFLGGGQPDQVNLIVRGSKQCSNFILETTGQEYKLDGRNGNRGGSFSISSGRLEQGWNQIRLTVRSNSGAHSDDVAIWVNVVPTQPSGSDDCKDAARAAAKVAFLVDFLALPDTTRVRFDRVSRAGNYVYSVTVSAYRTKTYEIVTTPSCNVL